MIDVIWASSGAPSRLQSVPTSMPCVLMFVAVSIGLPKPVPPPGLSQHRMGTPVSPIVATENQVLCRYMYDGGVLSQGRLCTLNPSAAHTASGEDVLRTLQAEGVDLDRFYACIYETEASTGAWLRVPDGEAASSLQLPLAPHIESAGATARRVDVKLFRREVACVEEALADAAQTPCGTIPPSGYHAVGVVNSKNMANVGTLWRSAYQLQAQFMFTVGARYKHQPTDTVSAVQRVPLFELDSWNDFVEFAPRGAVWVAVETGGTPLEEYDHPRDAIYLLGSEDAGLPRSVLRACHDVVSLRSEQYASYNVAVAGTIVMYDRMAKEAAGRGGQWKSPRLRNE
jgi:tRNA(Leu) C34 or U34 (ribose-2'-O)-methylase TrmL